ncbi:hypothetical protein TUM20983_27840 [Mycobacterium antarcticum]|nr:hypothetical protein TUM20983_27840 [Mycolicibacterium sp. TUM20983]
MSSSRETVNTRSVRSGLCQRHYSQNDRQRGTSAQRGYGQDHRNARAVVLARDPICAIDGCHEPSTVADHWPKERRTIVAEGGNPNAPECMRGLCAPHHSSLPARRGNRTT